MKSYLIRVSAGALMLFLSLFSGVFSLVECFALPVDRSVLLALVLLCSLGAALVMALPLPVSGWITLAVLALVTLSIWRQFDQVLQGAQVALHQVSLAYHQELPVISCYELPSLLANQTTPYLQAAVTQFFAACLPLAALWLGVWILQIGVLWPAILASLILPALGLFLLRQPPLLCLAALVLFLALSLLTGRSLRVDAALGSRRVWQALLPLCLTMALLGLLFPEDRYQRSAWIEEQRLKVLSWGSGLSSAGTGVGSSDSPGFQSFRQSGPLRFTGRTMLEVSADQAVDQPLFLRGFSSATYTSDGWQPLDASVQEALEANDWEVWRFPLDAMEGAGDVTSVQLTVTHVGVGDGCAYLPYYPVQLPAGTQYLADAYVSKPERNSYQVDYCPLDLSKELPLAPKVYSFREYNYRTYFAATQYLEDPYAFLSDEAAALVQNYAQAWQANWYDQFETPLDGAAALVAVHDVAQFLASFTTYDQGVSATPAGQDYVSTFLTQTKRGYCMHYASAATLILRAIGIPARYAAGYVVDAIPAGETVQVPDRNAHAWVEVYVEGFGWYPYDVTPGFSGASASLETSPSQSATPAPSSTPTATPAPSAPATPSQTPSGPDLVLPQTPQSSPFHRGPVLVLSMSGLGAVALFFLQYRRRLDRLRKRCTQSDPNRAALCRYRYLKSMEKQIGYVLPERAIELAKKAYFSQHVLSEAELSELGDFARQARDLALAQSPMKKFVLRFFFALI